MLILELIVGALVLALVTDGPGGPTKWVRAKFLGEVA